MSEASEGLYKEQQSIHPDSKSTPEYDDETIIWEGSPSQWTNLFTFIFWGAAIICALVFQVMWSQGLNEGFSPIVTASVPWIVNGLLFVAFISMALPYLHTRYEHTQVTKNKIKESKGITSVFRKDLYCEISDITDIKSPSAGLMALFGLSTLILETNDQDQPIIKIRAIKDRDALIAKLMPIWRELKVERKGYFGGN